jgi:hypothetical protein
MEACTALSLHLKLAPKLHVSRSGYWGNKETIGSGDDDDDIGKAYAVLLFARIKEG